MHGATVENMRVKIL